MGTLSATKPSVRAMVRAIGIMAKCMSVEHIEHWRKLLRRRQATTRVWARAVGRGVGRGVGRIRSRVVVRTRVRAMARAIVSARVRAAA